eukprot:TRINITY_DN9833_c0_g2_i1.p1 TRINITY_DN9833_c0_g2~~TRINITY_DN9833_c0_g2_i1.p1  ORF type:complete len:387 (+),score=54.96 TRINITY_DN9833_c0_g2_i1:41-1162(+)
MADNHPDPIEGNPINPQKENEQNPQTVLEQSLEDVLKSIKNDYQKSQNLVLQNILVLKDETRGLMTRNLTTKVADKMNGNEKIVNLENLKKKLEEVNESLNECLLYVEWLLSKREEIERVEESIRESARENSLETNNKEIANFENKIKKISAKTAVAIPTLSGVVGGGIVTVVVAGMAGVVKAKLISIAAILASIGIAGVAACGVGTVTAGCLIGVTVGIGIYGAVWLIKAYQIGKARKGRFEEFVEFEKDLDEKRVLIKLSIVSNKFKRLVKQVKDRTDPGGFVMFQSEREEEIQRNKAVEQYHKVYAMVLNSPMGREEERKAFAKQMAEDACKTALGNDLVYDNGENFEKFLRERITPDRKNSLGGKGGKK